MKDILKKQKIKKRTISKKLLLPSLLVFVFITGGWLWWRSSSEGAVLPLWSVAVKTMDASPLPPRVREYVLTTAGEHLQQGRRRELLATAAVLGAEPQLAAVHVIRTARDRVVVYVDVRRPALITMVNDKLRYVSRRGDVYGTVRLAEVYPVLEGVLDTTRQYARDEDNLYILEAGEQTNVQQALSLVQIAMQNGFICEKIIYEQYRGWQVKVENVAALVLLGAVPFAPKLHKLRDILASLRAKNSQATRIELDYEDKAFVQQKKI